MSFVASLVKSSHIPQKEEVEPEEKKEKLPWGISFSYARALQAPPLATWGGKPENVAAARKVFLQRLQLTVAADRGEYVGE